MSSLNPSVIRKAPLARAVLSIDPGLGIDLAAHDGRDVGPRRLGNSRSPTAEGSEAHGTLPRSCPTGATEHSLAAVNVKKGYKKGGVTIPVLRRVSLGVRRGEFLAVVGQSGSGKSTLLHLLGTLDTPDDGAVYFDGARIDNLASRYRDTLRNKYFGMIFQMYHLLPELDTLENVLAPMMIGQSVWQFFRDRRKHREAAAGMLDEVGLGHRLKHKPRELSGGEMQRAAIARALVTKPKLLLADEPTGNLDRATGREILQLLSSLNREQNLTIVMVTHDQAVAERADRIVSLVDGRIENV